jgi:hypothetical protein
VKIINWLSSSPGSLYKDSNKITSVFFLGFYNFLCILQSCTIFWHLFKPVKKRKKNKKHSGGGGHRGGAEPTIAELIKVAAAYWRRRCRRVGTASRPETGGGGRGEALSESPGGRTSPKGGVPWRRKLRRREKRWWHMLGIRVVGSGLRKQRLVTGVPWAVTARLVPGRGGRPTVKGGLIRHCRFLALRQTGKRMEVGKKIGAPAHC